MSSAAVNGTVRKLAYELTFSVEGDSFDEIASR